MDAPQLSKQKKNRKPSLLYEELTGVIRQNAFDVHRYFGSGFLEKVYENALANRLQKQGIQVQTQVALSVHDEDGTIVGHYISDLLIDDRVLVEIKATKTLTSDHQAQIMNYLKATDTSVGLLINFGSRRIQIKRFIRQ
jgi:GxxExxY protein